MLIVSFALAKTTVKGGAPRIYSAFVGKGNTVSVPAADFNNFVLRKQVHGDETEGDSVLVFVVVFDSEAGQAAFIYEN